MENVLIVDDSKLMRTAIYKMAGKIGLNVVGEAANGVEAIKKFKEILPDIVTLDITMPELDGDKCIVEMLKLKSDSKIVVISAIKDLKTKSEILENGAYAYLPKPLREEPFNDVMGQIKKNEV